ncbi:choloylglycine hydrolase [Candidatus Francisella endociliophora]|uniref:Choloylglycine hydrolase n=1 Tax=Candidatus Francisella endociliophora TaxID=653937 RepID=A0A097ENH7_9GAMM|nr:linear amide C-N hydrolase [Francisella sp. FSC1006]AIT09118.1 choloylglycine hydrolase [Francisella sp. FSC1006]
MKKTISKILLTTSILATAAPTFACSELNHNFGNDLGLYSARTMDVFIDLQPSLSIYPKGTKETGALDRNSLNWTDKYGYVSVDETNLHDLTAEGVNEKGLSAHLLYFGTMEQPERNANIKGVNGLAWVRYVLGNYSNVDEVIKGLGDYQIYTPQIELQGKKGNLPIHYLIEDAQGNSAIIEYVNKKLTVHKNIKAMTNEPSFDKQMENLNIIKNTDLYNIDMIPGGAKSENRFVRANFISENMPKASSPEEAVNYMFAAADSVSVPFVEGYKDVDFTAEGVQDKWPTQWKSVISTQDKKLYLSDVLVGNRIYVDLNEANLEQGQPVKTISAMNNNLAGDVTYDMSSK